MDEKRFGHFKKKLLDFRTKIINSGALKPSEDLHVPSEDLSDETDLAANVVNQQISFSIRGRELNKLREIEAALQRLEDGTYGMCVDCDEEITGQRLENQPWTTLCIVHAEEREREKKIFARFG